MKRILGIALALAVMLSMVVSKPAAAVFDGTVEVRFAVPCTNIAGEDATYIVIFANGELLLGDDGDYIDIQFPFGTGYANLTDVTVTGHLTQGRARQGPLDALAWDIDTTFVCVGDTVQVRLDAGEEIWKYDWVRIVLKRSPIPRHAITLFSWERPTRVLLSRARTPSTLSV